MQNVENAKRENVCIKSKKVLILTFFQRDYRGIFEKDKKYRK